MKKFLLLFLFILFNSVVFAQWDQIGNDILGSLDDELLGRDVAISADGNTIAIATSGTASSSGNVRVYQFNGSDWTQLGSTMFPNGTGDLTVLSVALNDEGSIVAFGAPFINVDFPGQGRVFQFNGTDWVQLGTDILADDFLALGRDIDLSASGQTLAIGGNGEARIYSYNGADWELVGDPIASSSIIEFFGRWLSLSADGQIVAISEEGDNPITGYINVYQYVDPFGWELIGSSIEGFEVGDSFGRDVKLNATGDFLTTGISTFDMLGDDFGAVQSYKLEAGEWESFGTRIDGNIENGVFGTRVGMNDPGTVMAATEFGNIDDNGRGKVYIFTRELSDTDWRFDGDIINGEVDFDFIGRSLDFNADGGTLVIGSNGGSDRRGTVKVYRNPSLSAEEFTAQNLSVYPNPVYDILQISTPDQLEIEEISIYNQLGQLVKTLERVDTIIDVSTLPNGMYYIRIRTVNGLSSKKFIKN